MLVYLLNYLSIPLWMGINKNKKQVTFIICLQMFLILALRADTLGADLGNYALYYKTWSKHTFGEMIGATRFGLNHQIGWGLESGYVWLCWICAKVGFSFHGFLVVHALICIAGIYRFVKNNAANKPLTLALFISFGIYQTFFYILRQALAFVVLLNSLKWIKKRKIWIFLLYVCVAILFHRVAIPFLFIYFLYNINITRKTFISVYIVCIGIVILIKPLYRIVFLPILGIAGKRDFYILGDFTMNNMIILMVCISLFIMLMTNTGRLFIDGNRRIYFWAMSFALFLESVSLYAPVYSRVAISLFFPFAIVLFTDVISMQKIWLNKVIWTTTIYLLSFAFYIYQLLGSSIVPYMSIMFDMIYFGRG